MSELATRSPIRRTVFYSWQSDTNQQVGRYLIRDALEEALKGLSELLALDDATRGEPGSPDIFGTILQKIAEASFFVPDLTIVGRYSETKCTPNPNVLVEYGYALSKLNHERIIPVLNKYFGLPEDLPFDLKARAIRVQFDLSPEAGKDQQRKAAKQLAGHLRNELKLAVDRSLWSNISETARRAVELFVTVSEDGAFQKPRFAFPEFCSHLSLSASDARAVVDELEGYGLIERGGGLGDSLGWVAPLHELFWKFDRLFQGWDVEQDARCIARKLVAGPHAQGNQFDSTLLAQELDWPPRRINPALTFLVEKDLVRYSTTISYPYAVSSVIDTANTRRFAQEQQC